MKGIFGNKSAWVGAGAAALLAFAAVILCLLAAGAGIWISRASLVQVGPAITPSILPSPTAVTPGAAQPPEAGVESRSSAPVANLLPSDIPLPEKIDPHSFVGGASQASFLADLTYADARDFYQKQLTESGWSMIPYGTRIGESSADLRYHKDDRILIVRIVDMPFIGLLIEITLQA